MVNLKELDALLKPWFLYAEPLPSKDGDERELSKRLAEVINEQQEKFITFGGAMRAAAFYTGKLGLPVALIPVRRGRA